ncbi:MAG: electron transport complex protein RnfA [Pseudomonadota bacterium]
MSGLFAIVIGAALVNNVLLVQLLGMSALFNGTQHVRNAATVGLFSSAILIATTLLHYPLYHWILQPLGLQSLQVLLLVAITAVLTSRLLGWLGDVYPRTHRRQHLSLYMVGANSAVVGSALLMTRADGGFLTALAFSVGSALGLAAVLLLFAALRERLETAAVPVPFRGLAIELVSAGLAAMALLGFAGIV